MTIPTPLPAIVEALRSAGATEEIIAAAVNAFEAFQDAPKGGRPRKHANGAERVREHRKRKKCNETSSVTGPGGRNPMWTG